MKKIILIVCAIGVLVACAKEEAETDNKWQLIEQLSDPGDGSGVFMPVVSNRTIELFDNGTFISNGDLCDMNSTTDQETTGTYSETDKYIYPDGCFSSEFKILYEIAGSELILTYFCIEPCRQKYTKVE